MQFKQRLVYIMLGNVLLLSGVVLLISALAQAPEKAQIAFVSTRNRNEEIYVMDADGSNLRRLTKHSAKDWAPSWFDPIVVRSVAPAGQASDCLGTA